MTRGSLSRLGYCEMEGPAAGGYLVEVRTGLADSTVRARAS